MYIMYGMPSPEAFEAAQRGEFAIGGCIVQPGNPDWECRSCRHEFATPTDWQEQKPDLPPIHAAVFWEGKPDSQKPDTD